MFGTLAASEGDTIVAALIVYLLVLGLIAVAFGFGARAIMKSKGRSTAAGFCLGFFLGVFGLLIAALLSPTPENEAIRMQRQMRMMGVVGNTAVAGQWAPDPFRRFELRYYDGVQWTSHVSSAGRSSTDPPTSAPMIPTSNTFAPPSPPSASASSETWRNQ